MIRFIIAYVLACHLCGCMSLYDMTITTYHEEETGAGGSISVSFEP